MNLDLSLSLSPRQKLVGGGGPGWPTFPVGAKVITVGDSITQDANIATSNGLQVYNQNDGIITWALAQVPCFKHSIWYDVTATSGASAPYFRGANFGISGDTATGVYDRITPILNTGADIAVVLIGTNTGTTDAGSAVKIAKIQSIVDDLVANGFFVIIGTILPRTVRSSPTGYQLSPAQMAPILETNDFIRTLGSANIAVWDSWNDMLDPAYTESDPEYGSILAAYTKDDVHISAMGAYTAAQTLVPILRMIAQNSTLYSCEWFENNGESNRITNGDFSGTAGSKVNGATGTVATSWTLQATASGNTIPAGSLIDNASTGGKTQRVVLTSDGLGSGTSGENSLLYGSTAILNNTGLADGDYVQMFMKVKVTNNSNGLLAGLKMYMTNNVSGKYSHGMDMHSVAVKTFPIPTDDLDMWVSTEPVQWVTGSTFFYYLTMSCVEGVAGSATVDFERIRYKKVASPVTEFPYTP